MKKKVNSIWYLMLSTMIIVSFLGLVFSVSYNNIYRVIFACMAVLFSVLLIRYEQKISKVYGPKTINKKRKIQGGLAGGAGALIGVSSGNALNNISFYNISLWVFVSGILVFMIPIILIFRQDYSYYKTLELKETE